MLSIRHPPLRPANLRRSLSARVPAKAVRDFANRLLYGRDAPLSDEGLWVDPSAISALYLPDGTARAPRFRRGHSGLVRAGDWDLSRRPLEDGLKDRACRARFVAGQSWEETGLFDALLARIARDGACDGCRTLAELKARYAAIDRLFDEVARTGRLRPQAELPGRFRREHGGVFVHVARDGSLMRAGGGIHRHAIARILGLPAMPVQVGVVHRAAVLSGRYAALRAGADQGFSRYPVRNQDQASAATAAVAPRQITSPSQGELSETPSIP
jgi:hypothetical protein